jgi:V/A-type H+/Na+-transporting ATPase subunit D
VRNVPPTKTNLLRIGDELKFAKLGHELLDQKRNILVLELLNLVDQAEEYQSLVERSLRDAFQALERTSLRMGKRRFLTLSGAVNISTSISLRRRRVMGVPLPVVETEFEDNSPYYSPEETSIFADQTLIAFKEALSLMGRLAELKISIMRLARETRKTIRKVNALEKIAIPDLEETLGHIRNRLEENERDMFVIMKMVKARLEKRRSRE